MATAVHCRVLWWTCWEPPLEQQVRQLAANSGLTGISWGKHAIDDVLPISAAPVSPATVSSPAPSSRIAPIGELLQPENSGNAGQRQPLPQPDNPSRKGCRPCSSCTIKSSSTSLNTCSRSSAYCRSCRRMRRPGRVYISLQRGALLTLNPSIPHGRPSHYCARFPWRNTSPDRHA